MSARIELRTFRLGEADLAAFGAVRAAHACYHGLSPETPSTGSEVCLALRGGEPVARCGVALAGRLHGVPGTSGLISYFEALDAEAARALLTEARGALVSRGAARVLAPMNGSTWGRYRVALPGESGEANGEPAWFLGEPVNPPDYGAWIESAGFTVAARYESRIDETPEVPAADAPELARAVATSGISVRSLDLGCFVDELRALHSVSLAAFADNLYYTPLPWSEFRAQHEKLRPLLRPELVLIAVDAGGQPIAFQFAYLDPVGALMGTAPRAIVKTVATKPEARGQGLAGHMLDVLRERAVGLGARSVIHALMHVKNFSMKMSTRHRSRVYRRYALYEWRA